MYAVTTILIMFQYGYTTTMQSSYWHAFHDESVIISSKLFRGKINYKFIKQFKTKTSFVFDTNQLTLDASLSARLSIMILLEGAVIACREADSVANEAPSATMN